MKIFLYGFNTWDKLKGNITKDILKKIKSNKNLKKKIFEVKNNKKQFIDEIKKINPDIIIGLGMNFRGEKIRIERKAVNLKKEKKTGKLIKISKKGKEHFFVKLKIKKQKEAWISYNARNFVCNFSMYTISELIENKNIKYGFIHIPKTYNVNKAIKFVKNEIQQIS